MGWNIFRILGDCSHLLSKCILIFAIHRNRSAEGVSWITQVLYAVVFCSRYTDIFSTSSAWNFFFKVFYILSSFYTIGIMRFRYPRTRERELSWKLGAAILAGSLLLSPFLMLIFEGKSNWSFFTWIWDFSQVLESLCVLPQLLLLRQTSVPTVIDSFYLLALGAYRGLYCLNWIVRAADPSDRGVNAVSVIFGVVQTALYVDFFWVYYTRQRVKLRYGGVVDADDIRRGWLLQRIFGRRFAHDDDVDGGDEESAPALGDDNANKQRRSKWGARGISVSADDGTLAHEGGQHRDQEEGFTDGVDGGVDPDAKMRDPDELALALNDEDDWDEDASPPSGSGSNHKAAASAPADHDVGSGHEWRDS